MYHKILSNFRKTIRILLQQLGYEIRKYPSNLSRRISIFDLVINLLQNTSREVSFIQIGGNDGIYVDPIRKYYVNNQKWKGYIFEPNPEIFEKLRSNLKEVKVRITPISKAVSDKDSYEFLFVQNPETRNFASEISSLESRTFMKQKDIGAKYKKVKVETCKLDTFCEQNKIHNIDLLQVDTEGHEYTIIMDLNLENIKPRVIQLEIGHLNIRQLNKIVHKLQSYGYFLHWGGHDGDLICIKQQFLESLGIVASN